MTKTTQTTILCGLLILLAVEPTLARGPRGGGGGRSRPTASRPSPSRSRPSPSRPSPSRSRPTPSRSSRPTPRPSASRPTPRPNVQRPTPRPGTSRPNVGRTVPSFGGKRPGSLPTGRPNTQLNARPGKFDPRSLASGKFDPRSFDPRSLGQKLPQTFANQGGLGGGQGRPRQNGQSGFGNLPGKDQVKDTMSGRQTDRQDRRSDRQESRPVSEKATKVRENLQQTLANNPVQPFTPQWFNAHPNVAPIANHPNAAAAGWAAVAAFVGWTEAAYNAGAAAAAPAAAYPSESYAEPAAEPAPAEPAAEPAPVEATSEPAATPATAASQWMPLGNFALVQPGQTTSTMMIQLFVNQQGQLKGAYYHVLSDGAQPVDGSTDAASQSASWTIGNRQDVVFTTALVNLTKDESVVLVDLGNGNVQTWRLVRM